MKNISKHIDEGHIKIDKKTMKPPKNSPNKGSYTKYLSSKSKNEHVTIKQSTKQTPTKQTPTKQTPTKQTPTK